MASSDPIRQLLEAASFAARAHRHQIRKDGQTPYIAHPFRVCLIVRHVFGIDDPSHLTAALLHDTIEDTTTDFDDLAERFGPTIADSVAALSKDTRLPDDEREAAYMAILRTAPPAVKIAKLADIYDNLTDSHTLSSEKQQRTRARSRKYLEALDHELTVDLRRAFAIVSKLLD